MENSCLVHIFYTVEVGGGGETVKNKIIKMKWMESGRYKKDKWKEGGGMSASNAIKNK